MNYPGKKNIKKKTHEDSNFVDKPKGLHTTFKGFKKTFTIFNL